MGLDMYLEAKRYVSPYSEDTIPLRKAIAEAVGLNAEQTFGFGDSMQVVGVDVRVGYWRKANQIHDWFVRNVQGGEDNCAEYCVSRDQLESLRAECREVLAHRGRAEDLLPTAPGFFFGSTEYDEGYFQDLEHTVAVINGALQLPDRHWEFYYTSSW